MIETDPREKEAAGDGKAAEASEAKSSPIPEAEGDGAKACGALEGAPVAPAVHHMDPYRLGSKVDKMSGLIDWETAFKQDVCLIEWPDKMPKGERELVHFDVLDLNVGDGRPLGPSVGFLGGLRNKTDAHDDWRTILIKYMKCTNALINYHWSHISHLCKHRGHEAPHARCIGPCERYGHPGGGAAGPHNSAVGRRPFRKGLLRVPGRLNIYSSI